MTDDVTKLLIVDRHKLITDLLETTLNATGKFSVSTAVNIDSAVECLASKQSQPVDLVLLELDLAEPVTVRSVGHLAKAALPGKTVLFSTIAEQAFIENCIQLGTYGFIPKSLPLEAFQSVMGLVSSGQVFIPADLQPLAKKTQQDDTKLLSPPEMSVLSSMALGLANKEIASNLNIHESTVKMRVRSICKKLGATNRTQAVVRAQRQKLLPQH